MPTEDDRVPQTAGSRDSPSVRFASAFLLCLAVTIFTRVAFFVARQPRSVFRLIELALPLSLVPYLPAGLLAASVLFLVTRRSKKSFILLSTVLLLVSLVVWWAMSLPLVSHWVLPPADTK